MNGILILTGPYRGKWIAYRRRKHRPRELLEVTCLRCRATTTDPAGAGCVYRRGQLHHLATQLCAACLEAVRRVESRSGTRLMDPIAYRGAVIEPTSYRGRRRRWVPEARVRFSHSGLETHHPITSEAGVTCLTEERANEHAVHLAKAWIDLHG